MKKCSLCGRRISDEKYNFGLGCLKKTCAMVGIKNAKNLKYENQLNTKIQKLNNKKSLNKEQKQLLTNRYLTYTILDKIDIPYYKDLAKSINNDIKSVNKKITKSEIKRIKNSITLKEAFEVFKLYMRYKNIFEKIQNYSEEELKDEIQNLPWDTLNFAFSSYYEKKPYLSSLMQAIQLFVGKI